MIAGTFVRALPSWVLWLALAALVAASAGWGYTRGLSAEREARDDLVAAFAQFRAEVAAQGRQAQARTEAEITRQETINAQTHTAYGVVVDRLRALHAADRLRLTAGSARAGGSAVPADAPTASRADAAAADAGPDPGGDAATEAPGSLTERCQAATLQCVWLQHWIDEQAAAVP
ncbi:MAG: hypothetical protein IV112_08320 [Methyloversatilis discipulorum]|uniref:hypothetical protein n=1 Tax=Methyloversatilis discipulorum TaxID=1119528 RepID=UPI0026F0E6CB|nr:hypothetical protein [Methyloversatilis discipulorum]MBT9516685.1 hypothetical protein [Methyloversatilis discipulorum]